jgi:hypothetical protein
VYVFAGVKTIPAAVAPTFTVGSKLIQEEPAGAWKVHVTVPVVRVVVVVAGLGACTVDTAYTQVTKPVEA